eukprot:78678-Hanusia_phi.AAC.1
MSENSTQKRTRRSGVALLTPSTWKSNITLLFLFSSPRLSYLREEVSTIHRDEEEREEERGGGGERGRGRWEEERREERREEEGEGGRERNEGEEGGGKKRGGQGEGRGMKGKRRAEEFTCEDLVGRVDQETCQPHPPVTTPTLLPRSLPPPSSRPLSPPHPQRRREFRDTGGSP